MSEDPWTDPEPQPGDFDAGLAELAPDVIEGHEGDPAARLRIVRDADAEELLARLRRGLRR